MHYNPLDYEQLEHTIREMACAEIMREIEKENQRIDEGILNGFDNEEDNERYSSSHEPFSFYKSLTFTQIMNELTGNTSTILDEYPACIFSVCGLDEVGSFEL